MQALPGFRDFLPDHCAARNYIFARWREVARRYSFVADSDLIALCIDILRAFGLTEKDFVVRISDREFWTDFLRQQELPTEKWEDVLQTIDKSGREPREKTEEKLGKLAEPVFSIF